MLDIGFMPSNIQFNMKELDVGLFSFQHSNKSASTMTSSIDSTPMSCLRYPSDFSNAYIHTDTFWMTTRTFSILSLILGWFILVLVWIMVSNLVPILCPMRCHRFPKGDEIDEEEGAEGGAIEVGKGNEGSISVNDDGSAAVPSVATDTTDGRTTPVSAAIPQKKKTYSCCSCSCGQLFCCLYASIEKRWKRGMQTMVIFLALFEGCKFFFLMVGLCTDDLFVEAESSISTASGAIISISTTSSSNNNMMMVLSPIAKSANGGCILSTGGYCSMWTIFFYFIVLILVFFMMREDKRLEKVELWRRRNRSRLGDSQIMSMSMHMSDSASIMTQRIRNGHGMNEAEVGLLSQRSGASSSVHSRRRRQKGKFSSGLMRLKGRYNSGSTKSKINSGNGKNTLSSVHNGNKAERKRSAFFGSGNTSPSYAQLGCDDDDDDYHSLNQWQDRTNRYIDEVDDSVSEVSIKHTNNEYFNNANTELGKE